MLSGCSRRLPAKPTFGLASMKSTSPRNAPALPLSRLEAMDDRAVAALLEGMGKSARESAVLAVAEEGEAEAASDDAAASEDAADTAVDRAEEEESHAEVDFNGVMTAAGDFVEVQGTAEGQPFSRSVLDTLLALAGKGIELEAPIKDFPDFEQLEFKGQNLMYLDPFLKAMKALTVRTSAVVS